MTNIYRIAWARKQAAERELGLPHVHWLTDVMAGLAVMAVFGIGAMI